MIVGVGYVRVAECIYRDSGRVIQSGGVDQAFGSGQEGGLCPKPAAIDETSCQKISQSVLELRSSKTDSSVLRRKDHINRAGFAQIVGVTSPIGAASSRGRVGKVQSCCALGHHHWNADRACRIEDEIQRNRRTGAAHIDGAIVRRRRNLLHLIVPHIGDEDVPAPVHRHATGVGKAAAYNVDRGGAGDDAT